MKPFLFSCSPYIYFFFLIFMLEKAFSFGQLDNGQLSLGYDMVRNTLKSQSFSELKTSFSLSLFFFLLFRAALAAYGSSQVRG